MFTDRYENFTHFDNHNLVKHKMTLLRDKNTLGKDFREVLEEITLLVAVEALKDLPYTKKTIQTPLASYSGIKINKITLIPIIRAGLAMMAPLQRLLPDCKTGFMGVSRDNKTLQAKEYYVNIPAIDKNETALILDPMLATGNTVVHTIKHLLKQGVVNISVIGILATPHALDNIFNCYSKCKVFVASLDEKLDDKGYIVPGLGDAGDRIFNT